MPASSQKAPAQFPDRRSFVAAQRVQPFGTTVFGQFTALAGRHGAVNLGQGFPDFAAPDFVKAAAQQAIARDLNQYAPSAGHPRLVEALAAIYSPLFGRSLDPMSEIVITTGATEGIFAAIQALIDPGDEVLLLEPFYDSYPAAVAMAGGIPVYIPLRAPAAASTAAAWTLDMAELAAAFSHRTRLLVLNTPHNPSGKVFSREELAQIAQLVRTHDVLVLSDEVYEWIVFGDARHTRIATLPGMAERTVTLGSAGKTFSVTGWKIGWAIAPAPIAHAMLMAHQWIPFCATTPLQEAVAIALEEAEQRDYFAWLRHMYQAKRDRLTAALQTVGLIPAIPDGSYFILADTGELDVPVPGSDDGDRRRDVAVCRWLTTEVGVAAIPPSAFYSPPHRSLTDRLARFCFCKIDEVLDEATRRLVARLGS